ncbi:hypothetical protein HDU93_006977, partial [Gonapodya sp. JEL0774]
MARPADPLLLAALGQHFLATASNIARASDPRNVSPAATYDTTTQTIREAVRCFTAILSTPSLKPMLEIQTRLQIAEILLDHTANADDAEIHLQKALNLCGKQNRQHKDAGDLYFRTRDLFCRVYERKGIIKQALAMAKEAASESDT